MQSSYDVLVEGDRIVSISPAPDNYSDPNVIDVGGKTPVPGLIDAHAHITGLSLSPRNTSYPISEIAVAAANYLHSSLIDGFTSIREAGGADHGIARLLAEGKSMAPGFSIQDVRLRRLAAAPIFAHPMKLMIREANRGPFSIMSVIADGVDSVRKAAREELRRGASQLKVFVSGGVGFPSEAHPTIYEYSLEELRAIVRQRNHGRRRRGREILRHGRAVRGPAQDDRWGRRAVSHASNAGPRVRCHSERATAARIVATLS